jgi:hypothetical protein
VYHYAQILWGSYFIKEAFKRSSSIVLRHQGRQMHKPHFLRLKLQASWIDTPMRSRTHAMNWFLCTASPSPSINETWTGMGWLRNLGPGMTQRRSACGYFLGCHLVAVALRRVCLWVLRSPKTPLPCVLYSSALACIVLTSSEGKVEWTR